MKEKIILDLEGGTGAWSLPYKNAGYDVRNITLPYWDITDERTIQYCCSLDVYGILFALDCTVTANSGARWFWQRITAEVWDWMKQYRKGMRIIEYHRRKGGLKFWCLENPVGKLRECEGDPVLIFNPCDYGDPYTKTTLLWGDFNPPKKNPVEPLEGSKIHKIPPSEKRKTLRAITPPGFAKAFFEANK
jgi:hypothetical protein